jgi:hypothetical protein
MWRVAEQLPVRIVAGGSLLFAAGVAAQALTQGSASADAFHQLSLGPALENAGVAAAYTIRVHREMRAAATL